MTTLSGWGRFPKIDCVMRRMRTEEDVRLAVTTAPETGLIARGNGRSYGDSALNADLTLDMRGMDRLLSFDAETGVLVAEAGAILGDIVTTFLPRGFFPLVTPGTKFVTLGGAIAADVHGKNHHLDGAFRASVVWIDVMGADGTVTRAAEGDALYDWTIGGMGLTGVILRAAIRLRPVQTAWIRQTTLPAPNLDAVFDLFERHAHAPYSVAWIDGLADGAALGRSILMLGEHAALADLPTKRRADPFEIPRRPKLNVPIDAPAFLLNAWTMRAFNAAFYHRNARRAGVTLCDWDSYFYPLDMLNHWNRVYGRRGFMQFQCVLPLAQAAAGLAEIMHRSAEAGQASFLAVLKRFGAGTGRFSFPEEGYTVTLDFAVNDRSLALMTELDEVVATHGGRYYLAKDARVSSEVFHQTDPRAAEFAAMRRETGLTTRFASAQSHRLAL